VGLLADRTRREAERGFETSWSHESRITSRESWVDDGSGVGCRNCHIDE